MILDKVFMQLKKVFQKNLLREIKKKWTNFWVDEPISINYPEITYDLYSEDIGDQTTLSLLKVRLLN